MTITTNTLGSNSAEIVIQGPETIANVGAAVQTFLLAHGWYLVPDTNPSTTANAVSASGNIITVTSSTAFVVGMPVFFTGSTFGGIATSSTYFILTIPDSTHVTISTTSPIQNAGVTSAALVASATGILTMACPTTASSPTGTTMGLAGNSTNNKSRVYWTFALTGQVIKYIRLNFADLSLDTAQYFTAAGASVDSSTGSSQAYRINFVQHFSYPRDYYLNTATTSTAAANAQSGISGTWSIGHNNANTSGSLTVSTSPTTAYSTVGLPVYPGQQSVLYSPSSGNYAYRSVSSYVDATGTVTWGTIQFATANGGSYSDWVVLWPTMLNYNNSNNPAYVYISATARAVCIQTRNVDGQWNDWTAVTEFENPMAIDNGTTLGNTAWGLTTGMMSANTGVVCRANGGFGFSTTSDGTANSLAPFSDRITTAIGSVNGYVNANYTAGAYSMTTTATASITATTVLPWLPTTNLAESTNGMYGKYNIFTGPFSSPRSPSGKTGSFASQTTKLITPLGESGLIGVLLARANPQTSVFLQYNNTTVSNAYHKLPDIYSTVHFKGMADIMTNQTSTRGTGSGKHFALTPQITLDISNETNITNLLANYTLDSYYPARSVPISGGSTNQQLTGLPGNQSDMNMYRTLQPSPMGRIYGIKYVTTGISALNTMGIATDANGFASSSGSSTNHLTFNYPSTFNSPDLNLSLNYDTGSAPYALYCRQPEARGDTATTQNNTRTSQSVSVAFPK